MNNIQLFCEHEYHTIAENEKIKATMWECKKCGLLLKFYYKLSVHSKVTKSELISSAWKFMEDDEYVR